MSDEENMQPFEMQYAQCSNMKYKNGKGCRYTWVPRKPMPKKCPRCGAAITWKKE